MIGNPYKGSGFRGLIHYLYQGRKNDPKPHRVIWSEVRNLPSTKPEVVAGIMMASAAQSLGVKKPVYHLPISWPPEEQLSKEMQLQVADQLIADLGLTEHEQLIVAHSDGDCPHIHIVINRVHPETGRVWNAWRDVFQIMKSLERQEKELGLQIVDRPDLEDWRAGKTKSERERKASRGERKRAEREGDAPLAKWSEADMRKIRSGITQHFKDATSWEDLSERLDQHKLHLRKVGQGFRICGETHYMTLSKIGKHAREDKLADRFSGNWAEYESNREISEETAAMLELPQEGNEHMLEHLENLKRKHAAEDKIVADKKVRSALLSAKSHAYFISKEKEAIAATTRLENDKLALRRSNYIEEKVKINLHEAKTKLDELFEVIFKDRQAAMKELDVRLASPQRFEDIELGTLGRKKGIRIFSFRTEARKASSKALKKVPRGHKRLMQLNNQNEIQEHEGLTLSAKIGVSKSKLKTVNEFLNKTGDSKVRKHKLERIMHDALRDVDPQEIENSDIHEDEKELLIARLEETKEYDRIQEKRVNDRGFIGRDRDGRDDDDDHER